MAIYFPTSKPISVGSGVSPDLHKKALTTGIAGKVVENENQPIVDLDAMHAKVSTSTISHNPESISWEGPFKANEGEKLQKLDQKQVIMKVTKADPEGLYSVGEHRGYFDSWGTSEDQKYAYFSVGNGKVVSSDNLAATITPVQTKN